MDSLSSTFQLVSTDDIRTALVNLKQLTFEVTDACNLKCRYCGFGDLYTGYDARRGNSLHFSIAKFIIDYLATIWEAYPTKSYIPHTYISFYGGEPLMNMSFIKETVCYIESLKLPRHFAFSMTTNAMLLPRYMDYLVEKDFHLLISLDGDREGNRFRVQKNGDSSFDTVFTNVKLLQQSHPSYFQTNVNFNTVLHCQNSIESVIGFFHKEFEKQPSISELNDSGIREGKREVFEKIYRSKKASLLDSRNPHQLSETLFISDPDVKNLLLYLYQYSGNVFKDYNELLTNKKCRQYFPTGTCIPFSRKMFITVNGRILPCEKIDHCFSYGTVNQDGVHLDCEKVAQEFNTYLGRAMRLCSRCFRGTSCSQCLYYFDDIHSSCISRCRDYLDKEGFRRYKSVCLKYLDTHPYLYKQLMEKVIVD